MLDTRIFIQNNYTPYYGDESFLVGPTEKTKKLWAKCLELLAKERENGVLDVDLEHFSGINSFEAGYIDQENEVIYGLQTDAPLKRIVNPFGGIRMAEKSVEAYGYELNRNKIEEFKSIRKTHNDGVFDAYTAPIKVARHNHLLTGLPDAYGRGRIIGDYRLVALLGTDEIINRKKIDLTLYDNIEMSEKIIRWREEISMQIKALKEMTKMAKKYNIEFLYRDFRPGFREGQNKARELGLYMQKYCGCIFSEEDRYSKQIEKDNIYIRQ